MASGSAVPCLGLYTDPARLFPRDPRLAPQPRKRRMSEHQVFNKVPSYVSAMPVLSPPCARRN